MGLTMGADDYVTKPFVPMELIARVKSQLRRYKRYQQGISEAKKESGVYRVGELMLNETERVVTAEGEELQKGTMKVDAEADLFKVRLSFPLIKEA